MISLFFSSWIDYIIHGILIIGIIGTFGGAIVSKIPLISQYGTLVKGVSIIALIAGVFFEGYNFAMADYRAKVKEFEDMYGLTYIDENNNILGAGTIAFSNYPLDRVAFVTAVGGRLVCNRDTVKQIKNIAKANGATVLQALGRPSIVRLWRKFNFKPLNTIVEMIL